MARPRKPTAALQLAGAFQKNPSRARERANEPVPEGAIGEAPDTLTDEAAHIWDDMARVGFWLTDADAFLLEIAANMMASFRRGSFESKDISVLVNTLNKLGFGPAERSKIKAPRAKDDEAPSGFERFNS
jgi:hypothetical protein